MPHLQGHSQGSGGRRSSLREDKVCTGGAAAGLLVDENTV